MQFIDLVKLKVKAGKGGDGIIAFRRELYVAKGGPSGGDGGNGGHVIFVGESGVNTLLDLRKRKEIVAEIGENGKNKDMHGKRGKSVYIKVPLGTIIKNAKTEEIIGDITQVNQELIVAKGGIGGRGNARFASSINRIPKICENGSLGEELEIICELKLLANAGLIGLPNAGKSTLLRSISAANPIVADYPFTTLIPQLGVVTENKDTFVIADLPGLIAGASDGKGLGLQFLRHIERCQVLVHMLDISNTNENHYLIYQLIRNELGKYNKAILEKPEIIVVNKIDMLSDNKIIKRLERELNKSVFQISALNKTNLGPLVTEINNEVQAFKTKVIEAEQKPEEHVLYQYQKKNKTEQQIFVTKVSDHEWAVTGEQIAKIAQRNPMNTHQNILLFKIKLQDLGVFEQLRKQGIKKGDAVKIFNYDMIWEEDY